MSVEHSFVVFRARRLLAEGNFHLAAQLAKRTTDQMHFRAQDLTLYGYQEPSRVWFNLAVATERDFDRCFRAAMSAALLKASHRPLRVQQWGHAASLFY